MRGRQSLVSLMGKVDVGASNASAAASRAGLRATDGNQTPSRKNPRRASSRGSGNRRRRRRGMPKGSPEANEQLGHIARAMSSVIARLATSLARPCGPCSPVGP